MMIGGYGPCVSALALCLLAACVVMERVKGQARENKFVVFQWKVVKARVWCQGQGVVHL